MKKNILIFGALITALLILFQLSQYQFFKGDINAEIIIAVVSIIFFFLGLYFRKRMLKDKPKTRNLGIDYTTIKALGISDRELDVLKELAKGCSNKEIADRLFLSESTVKTHVSSLYKKLNVSRRPQAILRANDLGIVAET